MFVIKLPYQVLRKTTLIIFFSIQPLYQNITKYNVHAIDIIGMIIKIIFFGMIKIHIYL